MSSKFKYWLRWILVIPVGLISGLLATFPLHWILLILFSNQQEADLGSLKFFIEIFGGRVDATYLEYILYPAVIAYFFIYIGYKIAPKHKFKTALLLFGIYVGALLITNLFVLTGSLQGYFFSWRTALALLGAGLGLLTVKTESKKL